MTRLDLIERVAEERRARDRAEMIEIYRSVARAIEMENEHPSIPDPSSWQGVWS